jgi:hypothetical protein
MELMMTYFWPAGTTERQGRLSMHRRLAGFLRRLLAGWLALRADAYAVWQKVMYHVTVRLSQLKFDKITCDWASQSLSSHSSWAFEVVLQDQHGAGQ